MASEEHPHSIIEAVVQEEWGRVLSVLVAQIHDFELAEDALQDALIAALKQWQPECDGVPSNPSGWLLKVAKRKMIDQIRRRENFRGKEEQIVASIENAQPEPIEMEESGSIPDERLRLIFTCCHPAIADEARVALTLQTLGGLRTPEVARAFLVAEATMAQRIVRAKKKIKTAGIPYEVPDHEHIGERLGSVLSVLYLIFNEGYSATDGENSVRADLCREAIRLAHTVVALLPNQPEAKGLLALMLLHHSRATARTDREGNLVPLENHDRRLWDHDRIKEGLAILDQAVAARQPGPFQLQAAISALHAQSDSHDSTDWQQIYLLYQKLLELQPSPVVELNAVVALSYAGGPEAALEALSRIQDLEKLADYLPFHATEADLHRRSGAKEQSAAAYRRAIALAGNSPERKFLKRRLQEVTE